MTTGFVDGPVRVQVPATSANLGPGFDALGLALSLHDEVSARTSDAGLHVDIRGEGEADVPRGESHLLVRAMRRAFDELGGQPPGLALDCVNRIPHGRGLGSSAAAIVAGILLARGLVVDGAVRFADGDVLSLGSDIEGHPDNIAACVLGGLTIAYSPSSNDVTPGGGVEAVRRDLAPAIVPVVFVPPFSASTESARGLLPATVSHADAAFCAGRAALLVVALTGTPEALLAATEDRLHQSYRAPAMPDSVGLVARLRRAGHAAVISGAGPTVLVLARGEVEAEDVMAATPQLWQGRVLAVDARGAHVCHETEP